MNDIDKKLLSEINALEYEVADAYNIRKNGSGIERKVNEYINILSKEDNSGIDIYVKEDTLSGVIDIPVIITESGIKDIVYNDFHIGKNSNVTIIAGCGIHNMMHENSEHDGIHRFFLGKNSKVKYLENHYASGDGTGKKILNPTTEITMEDGSYMMMKTTQIKGVDSTIRKTQAVLKENTTLVINEKILTSGIETATTEFLVELNGKNSSTHVVSRSVATEKSYQEFISNVVGNTECYGRIECDAILKDNGRVKSTPEIFAKSLDASLTHEATIGKIAGAELTKLMSLGLNEKEAEEAIINGFLK